MPDFALENASEEARMNRPTQQRTPGPWRLGYVSGTCHINHESKRHPGPPECVYNYTISADTDVNKCCVAALPNVQLIGFDDWGPVLNQADAAFIVEACNAHDALVARVAELETDAKRYQWLKANAYGSDLSVHFDLHIDGNINNIDASVDGCMLAEAMAARAALAKEIEK